MDFGVGLETVLEKDPMDAARGMDANWVGSHPRYRANLGLHVSSNPIGSIGIAPSRGHHHAFSGRADCFLGVAGAK